MSQDFLTLCSSGHVDLAIWEPVIKDGTLDISYNAYNLARPPFEASCVFGHLEIAQWLYGLGGFESDKVDDTLFTVTCVNGHLEVAKWLYSIHKFNIHDDYDYAFHRSCVNGHLEVAQWLYELGGVDIHASNPNKLYDEREYLLCLSHRHGEVLEWLSSLCDGFYLEDDKWKINNDICTCGEEIEEDDDVIEIEI